MLTKLTIRNFKRFDEVEIELGNPVVLIGPNNSGKTTALQALALWNIGLKRWNEKRSGKTTPEKRPGVTINRRDLIAVPVPDANLLWHDLHVRDVQRINGGEENKPKLQTRNIRVDIIVDGVTDNKAWRCGFEFDYANSESFYCRLLRVSDKPDAVRMPVPAEALAVHVAFLPPMSGIAANEIKLDAGAINVRLGEGRTAEVLRNLCYQICTDPDGNAKWNTVRTRIRDLFGVKLLEPKYIAERGEIEMSYADSKGTTLDLSSSGRGLQQTLLLLAHLAANSGAVLLFDEPDAHLEILRQRQIYEVLATAARAQNSQIIAASHSEIILNEAADRDVVVSFVGKPHRIDDRGNQLLKSLKEIGFEQYYQAEQKGWVLYLEGATDLAILRAFAETLGHPLRAHLERPFVHYILNQPQKGRDHFRGLREAKRDLVGFILCDRLDRSLQPTPELQELMWVRREIENYLCQPETLLAYAEASGKADSPGPLFQQVEVDQRINAMQDCIKDFVPPAALRDRSDKWWLDTKASDDFLDRVFRAFFEKLGLPVGLMSKSNYHVLARFVPQDRLDAEVSKMLDAILTTATQAKPIAPENEP